jgi:Flp pilus assembly protein TadD
MKASVARVLMASAACALLLTGCETMRDALGASASSPSTVGEIAARDGGVAFPDSVARVPAEAAGDHASADPTGTVQEGSVLAATAPGLLGSNPNDDLNLGKRHFRETNYGLAEQHFRRAVEQHPRDAEAWLGLAASYDRLRRFDLADRAYREVLAITGPRAEVLNNQGYSYMLRGDYRRAREKLMAARGSDPKNAHVKANLALLEESYRKGKAIN